MNYENSVTLSGRLHLLSRKKDDKHFAFSIRHESSLSDGTPRKDFLNARAFLPDVQEKLKGLEENTPILVHGALRTSTGSGELYLAVGDVEVLPEDFKPENDVELAGYVHLVKAQPVGETGLGRYQRFAVRQEYDDEHGHSRRDFIVVRVYEEVVNSYDSNINSIVNEKKTDDPVKVKGTLRSSRGSGVNYVMCTDIK